MQKKASSARGMWVSATKSGCQSKANAFCLCFLLFVFYLPPSSHCAAVRLWDTDSQIAVPATTASTSAFYKLGNDSYKLLTQKMNWEEARRQCQADDGDLASVLDPTAEAFITLMMHKHNESVWIGLNNIVVGLSSGLAGSEREDLP